MSSLYITEYAQLGPDSLGRTNMSPQEPPIASQKISFTGTAGQSAALNSATRLVRIHVDGIASIAFGTDPTATTSDQRLVAGQTQFHSVRPDLGTVKISAVTNT